MDDEEYHKRTTAYIKNPNNDPEIAAKIEEFNKLSTYVSGGYEDSPSFQNLARHLQSIEKNYHSRQANRLFYLALPPSVFVPVATHVKESCYSSMGINRIIVEKPFGKDLDSCRELLSSLKNSWKEEETYRIDHYLGKEMVKNLLVLRFANVALGGAWDKNSISNVQISFKEPFGTEGRGGYFDEFGIIRDVLQNRESFVGVCGKASTLTCACRLVAGPEYPDHGTTCIVRVGGHSGREGISCANIIVCHILILAPIFSQVKVLRAIPPIRREDVLLGQYVANNNKPGYLDDDTVPKDSVCPTFAATVLRINNERWEGVPFILKAGKGMFHTELHPSNSP